MESVLLAQRKTTQPVREVNPRVSLIKWTGSKRRQAAQIVSRFPGRIATYYEPFLGGGSVLGQLVDRGVRVERYEASDSYAPLIAVWQMIKTDPDRLVEGYARLWSQAAAEGIDLYYDVRRSFNRGGCPIEFYYLIRTCRVGHVRINELGHFTSALDRGRAGVRPDAIRKVVEAWHRKLVAADVRFSVRDYRDVVSMPGDLLYLDPPYRSGRRYYGRLDYQSLFSWLDSQPADYLMSLDGHFGEEDRTLDVPDSLYQEHVLISTGDNPLHRLTGRAGPAVNDSLYIRRGEGWVGQPEAQVSRAGDGAEAAPMRAPAYPVAASRSSTRPHSAGMSEAIRSLLESNPMIKPAEVKRRLADRGMTVSSSLFRVVRHKWRFRSQDLEVGRMRR